MPRKNKSDTTPEEPIAKAAVAEAGHPPVGGAAPQEQEPAEGSPQYRPVRQTFTSNLAGVRAGEDKRFNAPQVFVDFADDKRATQEEKDALKEAGFRYRPTDKGYSALATPKTREARDTMAQTFTDRRVKEMADQGEGQERVNYTEFVQRFREDQEIGRDITDAELVVYRDNGTDVGTWREKRATTEGRGEVLNPENADMARYWFREKEHSNGRA